MMWFLKWYKEFSALACLPLTSIIFQAVKATWEHLSLALFSSEILDHTYCVQNSLAGFLYFYPWPNSLIVSSSTKGRKKQLTLPDHKQIDAFGCHFYSTGSFAIKGCNYLACMAHYIHGILDDFSELIPLLLNAKRARALELQSDRLSAAKQISTSKNILEFLARTLSLAVALCHFSWLQSTILPPDTRSFMEVMVFDGAGIFLAVTDSTLHRMVKNIKASRALGVSTSKGFGTWPSSSRQWPKHSLSPNRYWRAWTCSSLQSSVQGNPCFPQSWSNKPKVVKLLKQSILLQSWSPCLSSSSQLRSHRNAPFPLPSCLV